jgi:hypothetical protein
MHWCNGRQVIGDGGGGCYELGCHFRLQLRSRWRLQLKWQLSYFTFVSTCWLLAATKAAAGLQILKFV